MLLEFCKNKAFFNIGKKKIMLPNLKFCFCLLYQFTNEKKTKTKQTLKSLKSYFIINGTVSLQK